MSLAIPHDHGVLGEEAFEDMEEPSWDSYAMEDGEEVTMILPVEGLVVNHCSKDDTLAITKVEVVMDEGKDLNQEVGDRAAFHPTILGPVYLWTNIRE